MSLFKFKTHSKAKLSTQRKITDFRPVAAIPPTSTRILPIVINEDSPSSQFQLEEDDLWNEDELAAEVSGNCSKQASFIKDSPIKSCTSTKGADAKATNRDRTFKHIQPKGVCQNGTPEINCDKFELKSPVHDDSFVDFNCSPDWMKAIDIDSDSEIACMNVTDHYKSKEVLKRDEVTSPPGSFNASVITPRKSNDSRIADDPTWDDLENQLIDLGLEKSEDDYDEVIPSTPNKSLKSSPVKRVKKVQSTKRVQKSPTERLTSELKRFDLKPLEINEKTDTWLEAIIQNAAFFKISEDTPKHVLEKNLIFLGKNYVEVLEKVAKAMEAIPTDILKAFPGFDPDVFMMLRTTRRRMKAKIIQTENLLTRRKPDSDTLASSYIPKASISHNNSFSNELDHSTSTPNPMSKKRHSLSDLALACSTASCSTQDQFSPPIQQPSNAHANMPQRVGDTSLIDYTDLLYKTPSSKSANTKNTVRNDGASGEFDGTNFPHSSEMQEQFRWKFGLRDFRTNQLQVMNACLLGNDCFVLMPTGGGKSLCYQLPAVITPGVTIVVSPLRSLILDQVTKLLTLDIPAAHLSGDIKENEASDIYQKLNAYQPELKLLYVTPEKLSASAALRGCLMGLYNRNMLARFVIDEVHCVSQWGHDFRPDYKKLSNLRSNFPNVKILALTATATPRVRTDILHQLQITHPKWFLSSFNRINLTYSVYEKKGKETIKDIASFITKEYKNESGVIYCFSRKECEDVARELKVYSVQAAAYHAGLADKERESVQNRWMNDKVKVVCATIAFGMGIDKLDVRFVIHYSIPKSIEGYYQESGRAGRDGEKASCILYYSYRDKVRILKLIHLDKGPGLEAARKVHVDNLFRVVAFAENKTDCRRSLQLEYFGESFDRKVCVENSSTTCDNCMNEGEYACCDVTAESKAIVTAVRNICGNDQSRGANFTMLHFVDVFKGSTIKKIMNAGHNNIPLYGLGKSWARINAERLFRKLIMEEYLKERMLVKEDGITLAYMKAGRRADDIIQGKVSIKLDIKKDKGKTAIAQKKTDSENIATNPEAVKIQENCHTKLKELITGIASAIGFNPNAIMNPQALRAMAVTLPETAEAMLSISHVTQANFDKYGAALLDITKSFAAELKAIAPPPPPKPALIPVESADDWLTAGSNSSPYFDDTDITYLGGRGRKRRYNSGNKRWPKAKRARGSRGGRKSRSTSNSRSPSTSRRGASSSSSRGGFSGSRGASNAGRRPAVAAKAAAIAKLKEVAAASGAQKFSTLMELPTNKNRFPRPKMFLSNI